MVATSVDTSRKLQKRTVFHKIGYKEAKRVNLPLAKYKKDTHNHLYMSRISRWKEFPKTTVLASFFVVVPTICFLIRPQWLFALGEAFVSVVLMTITMIGVGLFITLTYFVERRKKYALVALVFGVFLFLFFATIVTSVLSSF